MNKFVTMLVVLFTTLFASNALAFTPPPAPAEGRHIVDQAGKLSTNQFNALEKRIEDMNSKTKNEFGVLILGTMDGDNIEDAANATFKAWGVGKRGLDNGVLLVISVAERKSRIETGKGVGGDLPDLKCNQILKNNLAPHLRKGDFYGGIDSTLSAVSSQLESRAGQKAEPKPSPSCDLSATGVASGFGWLAVGSIAVIVAILLGRAHARRKREEEERHQRELDAARRRKDAIDRARYEREEKERIAKLQKIATPLVTVPEFTRKPSSFPPAAPRQTVPPTIPKAAPVVVGAAAAAAAGAMAAAEEAARRARRAKEEKEAEARKARQRKESEDRARKARDEESSRSSYSSYSSYDSGSSSSGSSDSGSGFGGGDSGGGGSSGDW